VIALAFFTCYCNRASAAEPAATKPDVLDSQPLITAGYHETSNDLSAEIGDTITLEVERFRAWLQPVPAENEKKSPLLRDPGTLILYIDGHPVKGVHPIAWTVDASGNAQLRIPLRRTSDNKDTWTALLTRRRLAATVSVGPPGELPLESRARIEIVPGNPITKWATAVAFLALLAVFVILARRSFLLRDGSNTRPWAERPYSLGRCQMALWFFTVLGSYIALRIILKDSDVLPTSVLALIGISAGTGLAAMVVDSSKAEAPANRLRELKGEYQQSLGRLAAVTAQLGAIPSSLSPSERAALVAERQQLVGHNQNLLQEISQQTLRVRGPASENFLTDLLTDSDGVSFYRFQIFAWTIVLWVIFIGTVVRTLAMPDFSDQVLGLLGISGGTYLGFKLPKDK